MERLAVEGFFAKSRPKRRQEQMRIKNAPQ